MKNLLKLSVILVATLFMGCSNDDNNNNGGGGNEGDEIYMKFTAEGSNFNIAGPATLSSLSTTITAYQGMDATFIRVGLWMPNDVTVGTYAITNEPNADFSAEYYSGDMTAEATTGTLVITSIGAEYIKGTFTFTAVGLGGEGTFEVTNGTFRAYSPTQP